VYGLNRILVIVHNPISLTPSYNIAATTAPLLLAIKLFLHLWDSCVTKEVAGGEIA
jgi:hypothetical protein